MTTHKTRGIVIGTIKYGETSIITHIYTELFGMQHYIVKGVRKGGRQGSRLVFFQPAACLDLEVQHNELKGLQFLKEYEWHVLYPQIFSEVKRNAIASYCTELVGNLLQEPESDPDFYEKLEGIFTHINKWPETALANIPVYCTLVVLKKMGINILGRYDSEKSKVLDLIEGMFIPKIPVHAYYLEGHHAQFVDAIQHNDNWQQLELNGINRNIVLKALLDYLKIHIDNYRKLKSLDILETIFY